MERAVWPDPLVLPPSWRAVEPLPDPPVVPPTVPLPPVVLSVSPDAVPVPEPALFPILLACPGGMQPLSFFARPGGHHARVDESAAWLPEPLVPEPAVLPGDGEVVPEPAVLPWPGIMLTPVDGCPDCCCWRARRLEPGPYTVTELVLVFVLTFALLLVAEFVLVLVPVELLPETLPERLPDVLPDRAPAPLVVLGDVVVGCVVEVWARAAPAAKKPAIRTLRSLLIDPSFFLGLSQAV